MFHNERLQRTLRLNHSRHAQQYYVALLIPPPCSLVPASPTQTICHDVILRYCHSRDLCVTEAQLPAGDHATVLMKTQRCAQLQWALSGHYDSL